MVKLWLAGVMWAVLSGESSPGDQLVPSGIWHRAHVEGNTAVCVAVAFICVCTMRGAESPLPPCGFWGLNSGLQD